MASPSPPSDAAGARTQHLMNATRRFPAGFCLGFRPIRKYCGSAGLLHPIPMRCFCTCKAIPMIDRSVVPRTQRHPTTLTRRRRCSGPAGTATSSSYTPGRSGRTGMVSRSRRRRAVTRRRPTRILPRFMLRVTFTSTSTGSASSTRTCGRRYLCLTWPRHVVRASRVFLFLHARSPARVLTRRAASESTLLGKVTRCNILGVGANAAATTSRHRCSGSGARRMSW